MTRSWLSILRSWLSLPVNDTLAAMEHLLAGRVASQLGWFAVGLIVTWYVYVPIHELLHALGCLAAGGTVTELQIQEQYGGALLARIFPFVVPGGEYAGRLSDFDTHGSDLVYLATDALPYSLSVLVGVPLLRLCATNARPLVFGAAVVLGLAPFYNLPGDYFEMGSIVTTRVASLFGGSFEGLRSDDLFLLLSRLFENPADLGLTGEALAPALALVALSVAVGLALGFATYGLGDWIAQRLVGAPSPQEQEDRHQRRDRRPDEHEREDRVENPDPE